MNQVVDEIVLKLRRDLLEQGLTVPETGDSSAFTAQVPTSAEALAELIDHTLLKPEATPSDIKKLCDEARANKFATVCVNGSHVVRAATHLKDSNVKPIAVVGFPLGAATSASKAYEAREAVQNGAKEIDMVINIGELKARNYRTVFEDLKAVVEASKPAPVKVILETALLDEEQKVAACLLSKAAGAAFVKTSTGFGPGGATAADIALMRRIVGREMGVKASGGIRTIGDAMAMIKSGANRIGASASVAIVSSFGNDGSPDSNFRKSDNKGSGGY